MIIKVCGLKESTNMLSIDTLRPDFIGIIFYANSARFIGENIIPETITPKAGVFVNSSTSYIVQQAQKYGFTYIQLHGDEDIQTTKALYDKGFKIIKAFSIGNTIDTDFMQAFAPFCTYFLFDTKGKEHGGNGIKFNWHLLENYQLPTPFLLSGGIAPDDVKHIKEIKNPAFAGVDINSRFETSPGIKNVELIKNFIHEIKQ